MDCGFYPNWFIFSREARGYLQQAPDFEWIVFSSSVLSEVLPCKQNALRGRLLEISQFLESAVIGNRFDHEFNPAWPLQTRKNHR